MAKQAYVYSGTEWVPLASEVTNLSSYQLSNGVGLKKIIPTSVAVGSGSGSVDSNGNVSFSGASTVSLNGCFSSAYQNYRIVLSGKNDTGTNMLRFRLRASGTDNSSSNYIFGGYFVTSNNSSGISYSTGTTYWYTAEFYRRTSLVTMDITNPFATDYTTFTDTFHGGDSGTIQYSGFTGGNTTVTTSYDGFTFYPDLNTLTGTIRVYGYN